MRLSASLLSVLLFAALAGISDPGTAATTAQIAAARTQAMAYLYGSQQADGSWGSRPGVEVPATSAVIESLLNAGVNRGASYNAAVSMLANAQPASTDGLARQIGTLYHTGNDTSVAIAQLISNANGASAWGTLPGQGSNVADTALALNALLDASPSYSNTSLLNAICSVIVPGQTSSGGWGYLPKPATAGTPAGLATPAILPTAYTLLALKKATARFSGVTCNGTSYSLTTLISNGLAWLLTKRNADNGFGENGTSGALETALAYRAVAAASPGNAALGPATDYLITSQQSSGAWASDPLQTAFVLQTFPGTVMTDSQATGVPDAVASVLWPSGQGNPRSLVGRNGAAIPGANVAIVLPSGNVGRPYATNLVGSAGTPPYTFSMTSGILPDGLMLSNGRLSGTPGVMGTFAFTYQTVDSLLKTASMTAKIVINPDLTWLPAVITFILSD